MNVQAAAISLQGVNFAIVLVNMDLVKNPGEADMAIQTIQPTFGDAPIVLMAQNEEGSPTYYGDADLVKGLRNIPIEEMPWKEYKVG